MTIVLKAMTLGSPRGKRQHRIKPIKCLDGALFIHTEDRGVHRRVQAQTHKVGPLFFQFRKHPSPIKPPPDWLNPAPSPAPKKRPRANHPSFVPAIANPKTAF